MQLTLGTFKGWRYAGALLLLVFGVALGVAYWSSVAQHRRYLTSRNFRLLTVLATQTQNLIDGQGRIFSGLLADRNNFQVASAEHKGNGTPRWLKSPMAFIPSLQHIDLSDVRPIEEPVGGTAAKHRIEALRGKSWLLFGMYSKQNAEVVRLRLSAAGILEPIFAPKLQQGAFDTLVFATQDGQVVFATGRREHELQWTRLDTLLRRARKTPAPPFGELARTTSVDDVVIAGVDYTMFIQPCCRQTMPNDEGKDLGGMIVAGLVETGRLDSASRAISPTLVLIGMAAVLLAVVSWPFLKLALLGDRQRISVIDVVQLGACSVLGLALATIIVLMTWAYLRVNDDVDGQLEQLARSIDRNLQQELGQAYAQLACMEKALVSSKPGVYRQILDSTALPCRAPDGSRWPYPLFEIFALLRNDGYQEIKASRESWATAVISVKGRHYFEAVKRQQYWAGVDFCPDGCLVESIWSWNTGIQQAVLSKPTGLPHLPVATLSIPLRSVIGAVVPPGFEYAVIDAAGDVQFHSDAQRNVHENLFQETDGSRKLRAVVSAHSAGALSVDYWGRQYRAYVRPSGVPGWSIVTLFDKQATRGLNLESAAVSVLLLAAYMVLWLGAMLLALRMGATWLWPDPLRHRHYRALAVVHVVLLAAFAAIAFTRDAKSVLIAGFWIPMLGWLMSYAVLNRPPSRTAGPVRRPDPLVEYGVMGSLLLVLSGVVPGTAFVLRAYDLQIESYVKHRQLRLAHALSARMDALVQKFSTREQPEARDAFLTRAKLGELRDVDLYFDFFYRTRLESIRPVPVSTSHRGTHSDGDTVLSVLEEYMPYYTEFSVEMRELLHERADDNSWTSKRTSSRDLELTVLRYRPGQALTVRSMLPSWRAESSGGEGAASGETRAALVPVLAFVPMIVIGFVGLAYAIVAFALRHVFLAQVSEPIWASGRLAATAGDNLFVLGNPAVMEAQIRGASPLNLGPIVRSDDPEAELRRALIQIERADGDRPILIPDLDADLDNLEAMRRKLALLVEIVEDRARTVVVLSQTPLSVLNDSVPRDPASPVPERERRERIQRAFVMLDWRDAPNDAPPVDVTIEDPPPSGWRGWAMRLSPRRWRVGERRSRTSESVLVHEGRPNLFLRRICDDIRQSQPYLSDWLSREQVLDEIEERAASYYRRLWSACSDDEKVVLTHIAQQRLANAASRRVVRRLLVRGLLFKDPGLRLMNDTFARFVLSATCRGEVVRLEGQTEPSTWDRLRMPLAAAAVSAGVFLYLTQREMFDVTLTVIGGVTAAVPVMFRMVSLITERRSSSGDEARA